jgi:hypothetical protein
VREQVAGAYVQRFSHRLAKPWQVGQDRKKSSTRRHWLMRCGNLEGPATGHHEQGRHLRGGGVPICGREAHFSSDAT